MSRLREWKAPRPDELGDTPEAFLEKLGGPTLIRVPGRDAGRTRVFSTLLHGNEPSGVRALHRWLRAGRVPAVESLCFVGSVEAALCAPGFAHRMLPDARDLNRCFAAPFQGSEGAVAQQLLAAVRAVPCEALLDVHNNTGQNPPYAVATRTDPGRMALASWFVDRFVDCNLRLGTLTEATEDDCPGLALECGRAGDPLADDAAFAALDRFLSAERLPVRPERDLVLLHEPVRVSLRPGADVAFGEAPHASADLTVTGDIDRHNFERVAPGTPVGWLRAGAPWPVEARGADGRDISRELFTERTGRLETRSELVPMMMTTDATVARLDCLFYAVRPRNVT